MVVRVRQHTATSDRLHAGLFFHRSHSDSMQVEMPPLQQDDHLLIVSAVPSWEQVWKRCILTSIPVRLAVEGESFRI